MRRCTPFFVLALPLFLAGCGGGGMSKSVGGTTGGTQGGGGTTETLTNATAKVHVDVATGIATVTGLTGPSHAPVVFQGNTIGFTTSVLIDQPGDVGRKALSVSLVNRSGEAIGQDPTGNVNGLRVIFGAFTNVAAFLDLRSLTNVSTLAGTGSVGAVNGANSVASFNTPTSVAVGTDGSTYVTDQNNSRIRKISNGVTSTLAETAPLQAWTESAHWLLSIGPGGLLTTPWMELLS